MNNFQELMETYPWLLPALIILGIWDAVWKLIALWKAARNSDKIWFICIALFNTLGVLPLYYLFVHKQTSNHSVPDNL